MLCAPHITTGNMTSAPTVNELIRALQGIAPEYGDLPVHMSHGHSGVMVSVHPRYSLSATVAGSRVDIYSTSGKDGIETKVW